MRTSLLLLLILTLASCGRDVKIANGLEKSTIVTGADPLSQTSTGVLVRKTTASGADKIQTNGASLTVSMYSSYNALEFIAAKPLGSSVNVQYKGKIITNNTEILLEEIK